jgi:hypothetical protein
MSEDFGSEGAGSPVRQRRWRSLRTGEEPLTSLSLAVRVVDAFTGRSPRRAFDVSVDGVDATPVRGRRGHYLFLDADLPSSASVTVEVTGSRWYEDASEPVSLSADDEPTPPAINPRQTPVTVEMVPTAEYSFPPATTLVRGVVRDERGGVDRPLAGAAVSVVGLDRTAITNDVGEFVFFFQPSPDGATSVVREDGQWLTKVNDNDPTLVATYESVDTDPVSVRVEAGRTARAGLTFVDPP